MINRSIKTRFRYAYLVFKLAIINNLRTHYTKGTSSLTFINSDCFLESNFKFFFTLLCSSFQLSLTLLVHYRYLTVFSLRGFGPPFFKQFYSFYSDIN